MTKSSQHREDISARQGLVLTTDTIHFNGRGASIIADLIVGWLHELIAKLPV